MATLMVGSGCPQCGKSWSKVDPHLYFDLNVIGLKCRECRIMGVAGHEKIITYKTIGCLDVADEPGMLDRIAREVDREQYQWRH